MPKKGKTITIRWSGLTQRDFEVAMLKLGLTDKQREKAWQDYRNGKAVTLVIKP